MEESYEVIRGTELVDNLWLDSSTARSDSNVLVTISDSKMEKTLLITNNEVIETKSSVYVKTPVERKVAPEKKWIQQLSSVGKLTGYVLAAVLLSFSALSVTGVVKARIVLTGSMVPAINPGDIILTTPPSRLTPKKGDVVAYIGRRFDGSEVGIFSHRIVGGDAQSGFIVKGDNNPTPDVQHPKIPDITGVVFFVIPWLGKLLNVKTLMILVPIIFGFWLILGALRNES